jgi:HNH endonuclease
VLLPWEDDRCVVCLHPKGGGLSNAHVIPRAVGGKLVVRNTCADCNSRLGATAEAGLKDDPRIRISIEDLQAQIPDLAASMRAGQGFIARDEEAVIRATPSGEGFRILDSPQEGGSRVKDPERAWNEIETTLRRQFGADDAQVAAVRVVHDAAPEGELVELAPGIAIRKGSVDSFTLPFTEPLVEDRCFLSIGYLFLSLLIQGAIYADALQSIRDALLRGVAPDGSWSVESYLVRSRPHEPWHGLAVEQSEPHVVLQVRLFGQHAWRVDLSRISCKQELLPARTYRLDLASGEEVFLA